MTEEKQGSLLSKILVPLVITLVAGGTVPWWWKDLKQVLGIDPTGSKQQEIANGPEGTDETQGSSQIVQCTLESSLESQRADIRTSILFKNETDRPVKVFWLDYSGQRKFFRSLDPRQTFLQQTFVTHPWVITDTRDNCINIYMPREQHSIVNITRTTSTGQERGVRRE